MNRIGAHVLYTLSEHDVALIEARRRDLPHESGNSVSVGQQFPGFIVRDWGEQVNLRVLLDGHGDLWVTSVAENAVGAPGTWTRVHYRI